MINAQTAIVQQQRSLQLRYAIDRLLDRLKNFVAAYPLLDNDQMPDHAIEWLTTIDGGPGKAVMEALMVSPDLWLDTLPSELVIVPRSTLLRIGVHDEVIDIAQSYALDVIGIAAAAKASEIEVKRLERDDAP